MHLPQEWVEGMDFIDFFLKQENISDPTDIPKYKYYKNTF